MENAKSSRRSFLAGLAAVSAATWLHDSDHITARVARGCFADVKRDLIQPATPHWESWDPNKIHVAWLGHASVLIGFYGFKVLTDPALFDWVGADLGFAVAGRKRLVAPALKVTELPPIDLVLISHAHMDHVDMPTLKALPKASHLITAPATSDLAHDAGFKNVRELRWGQKTVAQAEKGGLEIEAFEVKHWGARWKTDTNRGYNGYVISRNGRSLIFGGDTAYTPAFKSTQKHRALAAIMPIGSYGSKSGNHCTPEEAVQMLNESGAEHIIPVHHSTFPLGKEPLAEPLCRLQESLSAQRIALKAVGETWQHA